MVGMKRRGAGPVALSLLALLVLTAAVLAFPTGAAHAGGSGSSTVGFSIRPCIRICPDGEVQSNVPVIALRDGATITVVAR